MGLFSQGHCRGDVDTGTLTRSCHRDPVKEGLVQEGLVTRHFAQRPFHSNLATFHRTLPQGSCIRTSSPGGAVEGPERDSSRHVVVVATGTLSSRPRGRVLSRRGPFHCATSSRRRRIRDFVKVMSSWAPLDLVTAGPRLGGVSSPCQKKDLATGPAPLDSCRRDRVGGTVSGRLLRETCQRDRST
ncbi:hypothetical protein M885DRAFT_528984 [Pelagophyceae sp. CCMP2097]|nr:hypothetical protein M885DRAFT_528984 [Pelagophyceae sp. CCMP2097]